SRLSQGSAEASADAHAMRTHPHNFGPPIPGLGEINTTTPEEEMAAYDQLGPLTRRFLDDEMVLPWSSVMARQFLRSRRMDPRNRRVDAQMVEMLRQNNAHALRLLRAATPPGVAFAANHGHSRARA